MTEFIKVMIKPLSVNKAWQGKRFKTAEYKAFEKDLLRILKIAKVPQENITIDLEFGMSALSDIDNPIKPVLDILQKKYGFNDRYINELNVKKTIVKKGNEFIKFKIR